MKISDVLKRAMDLVIGVVLLLLTLPLLVIVFFGTALALRAWPLFTQQRIGRDGKSFHFVKFRTLPVHAPRYAGKYELAHIRVPWFCQMLRHLHLDELPQLLLVLTGRMSLVGPRPEMPYLHEGMDPRFAAARTSVRPGCTGLWQISEGCDCMIYEHPEYDEFYLAHRSVSFDLWIIWRTVRLLFPRRDHRLLSLAEIPSWVRDVDLRRGGTADVRPIEPLVTSVDA